MVKIRFISVLRILTQFDLLFFEALIHKKQARVMLNFMLRSLSVVVLVSASVERNFVEASPDLWQ